MPRGFAFARADLFRINRHVSQVKEFKNACVRAAKEEGFVKTLSGRRRAFPDLHLQGSAGGFKRAAAERQSVNFVIQGSASDFIKTAMKDTLEQLCQTELHERCCCCLQIHDELVFEVDPDVLMESAQLISKCMTDCAQLRVPMRVKAQVGKTWGELVPLEQANLLLSDTPSVPRAEAQDGLAVGALGTGKSADALSAPADGVSEGAKAAGGIMLLEDVAPVASAQPGALAGSAGHAASETRTVVKAVRSEEVAATQGGDGHGDGHEDGHGDGHGDGHDRQAGAGAGEQGHADKKRQRDEFEAMFDFGPSRPAAGGHGGRCMTQPTPPSSSLALGAPIAGAPGVGRASTQEQPALACGNQPEELGAQEHSLHFSSKLGAGGATNKVAVPLREIALSGINLHPLRANRLLGRPSGSKFTQAAALTSALFDDDTDQLDLDC